MIPWIIALQIAASLLVRPYIDLMPGFAVQVFGAVNELGAVADRIGISALAFSILLTMYSRERWLVYTIYRRDDRIGHNSPGLHNNGSFLDRVRMPVAGYRRICVTTTGIANATLIQQYVDRAYRGRVVS